jgi:hypothetical protein
VKERICRCRALGFMPLGWTYVTLT